ncbi:MAG: hypothetical protein JSS66_07250 [Armatimonadetes bacterium]|nr:hypothetical protein [Armatimonadota bacterium]
MLTSLQQENELQTDTAFINVTGTDPSTVAKKAWKACKHWSWCEHRSRSVMDGTAPAYYSAYRYWELVIKLPLGVYWVIQLFNHVPWVWAADATLDDGTKSALTSTFMFSIVFGLVAAAVFNMPEVRTRGFLKITGPATLGYWMWWNAGFRKEHPYPSDSFSASDLELIIQYFEHEPKQLHHVIKTSGQEKIQALQALIDDLERAVVQLDQHTRDADIGELMVNRREVAKTQIANMQIKQAAAQGQIAEADKALEPVLELTSKLEHLLSAMRLTDNIKASFAECAAADITFKENRMLLDALWHTTAKSVQSLEAIAARLDAQPAQQTVVSQ